MSCYSPLKAFPVGKTENGKIDYYVTPYNIHHLEKNKNGMWIKCGDNFIPGNNGSAVDVVTRFIEIPCGKCIGCRLDHSKEWANRCMMELKYHQESWFLTITYDDEHLPTSEYVNADGVVSDIPTLVKKDFQDFFKRLRINYERAGYSNKLRYYMCGEYGSDTKRPHYHAIVFGLHLDDLKVYSQTAQGYSYYNSEFLDRCWQGRGYIVVGEVTWETCAYTARYIMKKLNGDYAKVFEEYNIEPEFTLMSRKPGIGAQYFLDHPDCMDFDKISISTVKGGRSFKQPRYFEKLDERLHGADDLPFYKKLESLEMQIADSNRQAKLDKTSNDYIEMLAVEGRAKANAIRSLTRKGV